MSPEEIKKARAIIDAATPGPWPKYHEVREQLWHQYDILKDRITITPLNIPIEDYTFIAAARTGWPEALDEIERLKLLCNDQHNLIEKLNIKVEKLRAAVEAVRNEKVDAPKEEGSDFE